MVSLVLLDSTVLIDALRGRSAVQRLRALRARGGDLVVTSPINVEEIHRGVRPDEWRIVQRLFDGLTVIPIGAAQAERAGTWRREFAARGVTLSQADCLVAATALSVGANLATANVKDFPMPEVQLEHWPSE